MSSLRFAVPSGGRLQISVSAAGEVVPAFEVLDAVGGGVAEIGQIFLGHDPCPKTGFHFSGIMPAAFFWQGKMPAANFYTTVPFGLTLAFALSHFRTANRFPLRLEMLPEHVAWIEAGGGQALWNEPFGVGPTPSAMWNKILDSAPLIL